MIKKTPQNTHRKSRFVTLYIDMVDRSVDIIFYDPQRGYRYYTRRDGDASLHYLWLTIRNHHHTHYPAQKGWGVIPSRNGRARDVYLIN